ncbi:MAG: S8 family serine peptidase [Archangium sp.]
MHGATPESRCFVDSLGRHCASPLESTASGRTRWLVTHGGRTFEAEVADQLLIDADAPPTLPGVTFVRTIFAEAGLHLYRADDGDAMGAASRLASFVGSHGLRGVGPDLFLEHRRLDFPQTNPNDTLFGGQWYFDNIRAKAAWKQTIGSSSVEIAVIDDGCDLQHVDLRDKLLPGRDVVDQDDDPSFTPNEPGNGHGTACAGLVAASTNNGAGIAGVCPECRLRCVKLIAPRSAMTPVSADADAFSFVFSSRVQVASNSWGFGPNVPAPAALVTAMRKVITEGRDGKGTVVVFASGNDDGVVGADQVAAVEGVIAVGSVNLFDELTPYSNRGPSLALVAPAGTVTLDPTGAEGSDPGDTTTSFGGTSSACPIVAGAVGLMLSKRPELTATEVKDILKRTARRAPFAQPDENGHDDRYGHGVLDINAALLALDEAPVSIPVATLDGPAAKGCGCSSLEVAWAGLALLLLRRRQVA